MRGLGAGSLLAVGLLLAACATQEPDQHHGMAGRGDHAHSLRPAGPTLFISLAGQPFRGEPGEPYPIARWFAQVDRNGDRRIDRAEVRADAATFFHTLDRNQDGVLDSFEVAEPVASADAALDGKITLPEFLGAVDRRFEAVDVKHRGSLSLTDLPKTPVQRGADPAHGGRGQ